MVSICFTISRYSYLVYEGLSMKMDCVDINLVTHSQQVPVHPLSLVHGQPRQGGIEPAINCCAGNTTEGKIGEIEWVLHLFRGRWQIKGYKAHTAPGVSAGSVPHRIIPPAQLLIRSAYSQDK